jgi:hypothetical protein
MMRIHDVPPSVQEPSHRYPAHVVGMGLEQRFGVYARVNADLLDTDWIYLPVYWTNNYVKQKFAGLPDAQTVLDSLDPKERYFTVVQCDDGIYEKVPQNVLVFGAGGTGDIPIPLVCEKHSMLPRQRAAYLASFMGTIETGGPVLRDGPPVASSWDENGDGAKTRREMARVFSTEVDCRIEPSYDTAAFIELMRWSTFALAPRGYGRTSFRLYEAMDLGCIPVYLYWGTPWLPYTDVLDWKEFAVLRDVKKGIKTLPDELRECRDAWINLSTACAGRCFG